MCFWHNVCWGWKVAIHSRTQYNYTKVHQFSTSANHTQGLEMQNVKSKMSVRYAALTPALQKMQYFCDVMPRHWLRSSWTSEGTMSLQKLKNYLLRDTALLHLKRHFQQTSVLSSDTCPLPNHFYSTDSKSIGTLLYRKPASSGVSCERYHATG